jgi:hypothetical protein
MGVPPGNRKVLVSVPERYVAGADTRGRQEGRPYPWSQHVINELSGLDYHKRCDVWKRKVRFGAEYWGRFMKYPG